MTNCLVLGGANNVFTDYERALQIGEFQGVVTINDFTTEWKGPITAAVSLHGDKWPIWLRTRKNKGLSLPERVYAHADIAKSVARHDPQVITHYFHHLYPEQKESGSSGLFATMIALEDLGFDKVVLCGVPMTAEARHYFKEQPWGGAANNRRGWIQAKQHLVDRVRSMSGWTAEILGKPTVEWLGE